MQHARIMNTYSRTPYSVLIRRHSRVVPSSKHPIADSFSEDTRFRLETSQESRRSLGIPWVCPSAGLSENKSMYFETSRQFERNHISSSPKGLPTTNQNAIGNTTTAPTPYGDMYEKDPPSFMFLHSQNLAAAVIALQLPSTCHAVCSMLMLSRCADRHGYGCECQSDTNLDRPEMSNLD